jgi:hypothetical protein
MTVLVVLAVSACASGALSACNARVVDVGTNDASAANVDPASLDGGLSKSNYGCAEWVDEELYALREGSCGGMCSSEPESPWKLDSKQAVIAASAGQWMYCEGHLGPEDAIGVEFAPGCRLYFLRKDADGVTVRGTEARFQARYDIYQPRSGSSPHPIDIHIDDVQTLTFDVVAYRCPERLRLLASGMRIELAPGFVDAGRPDPTR